MIRPDGQAICNDCFESDCVCDIIADGQAQERECYCNDCVQFGVYCHDLPQDLKASILGAKADAKLLHQPQPNLIFIDFKKKR